MADDTANSPRRSLLQLWRSLRSTIRAANHIVPGASLVAMILAASMIAVFARVGPLMLFGGAMIVLTAALMIFVKTSNYGESMLV